MAKAVDYSSMVDKFADKNSVELKMPNGQVFVIKPPELLPDEIYDKIASGKYNDAEVAAAMIDDYAGYQAAGGTLLMLNAIIEQTREERNTGE